MNKNQLKYYQEKAQSKHKKLLIEECNSIITLKDVEFLKEGKLIESEGRQFEALAIVKDCPVSKYTLNKNNRAYGKPLWKKIAESNVHEGTYSLADHPEEQLVLYKEITYKKITVREAEALARKIAARTTLPSDAGCCAFRINTRHFRSEEAWLGSIAPSAGSSSSVVSSEQ